MRLYFVQPIIRQLNKDYETVSMAKDLPFELNDLKFMKTYKSLDNIIEVKEFQKNLDEINKRLIADYSVYSNDTHINFDKCFYDYNACLKVLDIFQTNFLYPEIEYNKDELATLSKTIAELVNDQISYLNIKYKEYYFSYLDNPFIKLLKYDFEKVMSVEGTFSDVIKFMCEFNNKYYAFKKQQGNISSDKRTFEFIQDCLRTSDTFTMVLRIYFKFMNINNVSDENMINYSHTYIER